MNTDAPTTTALTLLGHQLIRHHAGDGFDPFMVHGHPAWSRKEDDIAACFYYAVVVGEEFTVLFDNQGMGGMCKLQIWEMAAVWDTQELLNAMDLDRSTLYHEVPFLDADALNNAIQKVPAPKLNAEDLEAVLGRVDPERPAIEAVTMFETIRRQRRTDAEPHVDLPQTDRRPKGVEESVAPLRRLRRR